MGIFDKLTGSNALTPKSALLLSVMTMVAVDGDVDDDELAVIRRLDRDSRSSTDWDNAYQALTNKSYDECIQIVAQTLSEEQKLVAIANLIDTAMADGILAGDEKRLLEAYLEVFNIDLGKIEAIVDVIALKNNKSAFN